MKQKFHGDPARFEVVADWIAENYGKSIKYIADVAGGQGMLARQLNKHGYETEVIDPRGYTLVGIKNRQVEYSSSMAEYYDLVVGLHPDQATRPIAESASLRPTLIIPCCNFWDRSHKLGRDALVEEIESYYLKHKINFRIVTYDFKSPKNIGIITNNAA